MCTEKGGFPHCGRIFPSERVVEKKVKIEKGKLKRVEKLPQVCIKKRRRQGIPATALVFCDDISITFLCRAVRNGGGLVIPKRVACLCEFRT